MDAGGAGRLNRSSPSCLNRPAQRTDFFHGLLFTRFGAARREQENADADRKTVARTALVASAVVASVLLTPSPAFAECGDSQCQAGGCYDIGFLPEWQPVPGRMVGGQLLLVVCPRNDLAVARVWPNGSSNGDFRPNRRNASKIKRQLVQGTHH